MSTGTRLALRTWLLYLGNVLLCALFLMMMTGWLWMQTILAAGILVGFCLLCYNEGGSTGEHAVTLSRTLDKRAAEGKKVDPASESQRWNRKHVLPVFLAVALPLCVLATVNLIVSPNYPDVTAVVEEEEDPFHYSAEEQAAEAEAVQEPAAQVAIRVVTRLLFVPLLPLYTILQNHVGVLYALFIPFSFVMPTCTAVGYLRGPAIREKKLMDIARGKVRKRRGLLVGQNRGPRQPKPQV